MGQGGTAEEGMEWFKCVRGGREGGRAGGELWKVEREDKKRVKEREGVSGEVS